MLRRKLLLPLALWLFPTVAMAQAQPRYLTQMQAELQAMSLAPQCTAVNPQVATCSIRASAPTSQGAPASTRRFVVNFRYDDQTDVIYLYADRYGMLRSDAPQAPAALRRLMEINWELLVGKFEWSSATGEVRLSAVLNTDSNFDRRAFRGVVRALLRVAERYAEEVARLTGNPVGETNTGTPTAPAAAPTAPATPSPPSAPTTTAPPTRR